MKGIMYVDKFKNILKTYVTLKTEENGRGLCLLQVLRVLYEVKKKLLT